MSRESLGERVWYEVVVPIFVERFLLYLCAGAFLGLIINNGMGLDIHQRIGLGIALVGTAYFLGHTAYKAKPIPSFHISSPTGGDQSQSVTVPKSTNAPSSLSPEIPKQAAPIRPRRESLRSEAVKLHAEGLAFLMARDINMPIGASGDEQAEQVPVAYNSQTGSKFMEQYGARLIGLRSRMIDSKVWSAAMEKSHGSLNSSFESRIAAVELLDDIEEATRTLK